MGKSHKKRKRQRREAEHSTAKSSHSHHHHRHHRHPANPLYEQQNKFLQSIPKHERDGLFSSSLDPERRGQLWMEQADLGETLINQYSWATPDEHQCLRILKHFSPLIEIGCGSNAYWSRYMSNAGINVIAYDVDPQAGGRTMQHGESSGKKQQQARPSSDFVVQKGGPEVLQEETDRTLFLCYPDEDGEVRIDDSAEPVSMGTACLEYYSGDYVIHVGELYGDTLAVDQAPWGRSSGPEFQLRLASEFHCILKASLTNWLHVRDTISVWKRTETCPIVFAADSDDEEDDEEVEYRYIPVEERLPDNIAAPCLAHLLSDGTNHNTSTSERSSVAVSDPGLKKMKVGKVHQSTKESPEAKATGSEESDKDRTCPW